ncbi:MAG: DUF3857 domain-containing protein [Candidatus Zixiibacteriota bacterium]
MTRRRVLFLFALALVWCAARPLPVEAQTSIDGRHDIAALTAQAQAHFDLAKEDAVLLFDSQRQYWLADGRLVSFVHRIVRVNTDLGLDTYGDNRVSYDAQRCSLQVVTVRTWRDGQWWETGPSGKVETLPFALREAYDYTNMREMMLLHNGIEAPCVLELAYVIEDKVPFRGGADGIWSFARPEPAVESWFSFGVPPGAKPHFAASEGVPESGRESDTQYSVDVYTWKMSNVRPLRHPQAANAIQFAPHVLWSTWSDWESFGRHLDSVLRSAMSTDDPIVGTLDSLLRPAATDFERAEIVARFIRDKTRYISYPEMFWWLVPRSATRTYATAYGHRLDRAILAAALFGRAGLQAQPVFLGRGYGAMEATIPSLAEMSGVGVRVVGENLDGYYDPESGEIANGKARSFGRVMWRPGTDPEPLLLSADEDLASAMTVRFDLRLDTAGKALVGKGYLDGSGCFSAYDRMVGQDDQSTRFLGSLASSVLTDAKVTGFGPLRFDPQRVEIGFAVDVPLPEPDSLGRLRLGIGDPTGGVLQCLPDDVRLFHQRRESPVCLPSVMQQRVECRIDLHGLKVVYQPASSTVENSLGRSQITVNVQDSVLIISRELHLGVPICKAEDWPSLRAVLLADKNERGRTLLFKK